ncbi:MAG: LysM peptidoglycan-binding domain-containing protein [Clostridia bacterium]|nr:LysM peptidoglycan-binding domain-containing protein [Clostridia bacterium]
MIYTVRPGDTLFDISRRFGIPLSILKSDNGKDDGDALAVGEDLVILPPALIYTVREGDTVSSIAERYGISTRKLFRNNPSLAGKEDLYPGQSLVISRSDSAQTGTIRLNGYAYPFIDDTVLRSSLPYLTYLSVFTHGIKNDGGLIAPEGAERLVRAAKEYESVPLMMLTSLNEYGNFSNELVESVLSSDELTRRVIDETVKAVNEGGYGGVDVDFEYISGELASRYADFIKKLKRALGGEYEVFVSLAPKTSDDMPGILYEGHDYASLGDAADHALLMTYEWGYTYGSPQAVSPLDKVEKVAAYAVGQIPPSKLLLGMPNYGYDFKLPYIKGESEATPTSNLDAVKLAVKENAEIVYDEISEAPFFTYTDSEDGARHVVWFESARSVRAMGELANRNGMFGVSIWNIMKFFPQMYLQLDSMFDIL